MKEKALGGGGNVLCNLVVCRQPVKYWPLKEKGGWRENNELFSRVGKFFLKEEREKYKKKTRKKKRKRGEKIPFLLNIRIIVSERWEKKEEEEISTEVNAREFKHTKNDNRHSTKKSKKSKNLHSVKPSDNYYIHSDYMTTIIGSGGMTTMERFFFFYLSLFSLSPFSPFSLFFLSIPI